LTKALTISIFVGVAAQRLCSFYRGARSLLRRCLIEDLSQDALLRRFRSPGHGSNASKKQPCLHAGAVANRDGGRNACNSEINGLSFRKLEEALTTINRRGGRPYLLHHFFRPKGIAEGRKKLLQCKASHSFDSENLDARLQS
jgi:hypothetical protein